MRRWLFILAVLLAAGGVVAGWWLWRGHVDGCGRWELAIGRPGMDEPVRALAAFLEGQERAVYAGGFFYEAGDRPIGRLARWDGANWHQVARGINGPVRAMQVINSERDRLLVIGGQFTTLRGIEVNHIAQFDGASWSMLGAGMNDWVLALAVFDAGDGEGPQLYAAGEFTSANGVPCSRIARWDGEQWHDVGGGVNGTIYAMATVRFSDGEETLYVGGAFTEAGDTEAARVARWDGKRWRAVGEGLNDLVFALAAMPMLDGTEQLIAGGRFTEVDENGANNIAQWNGEQWLPLNGGVDHEVHALAAAPLRIVASFGKPLLFAGGRFRTAGGITSPRLAKWDGDQWHPITPGPDERVQALLLVSEHDRDAERERLSLYVGGSLMSIGRRRAEHIAALNVCLD